jgi:hypothetical protein
MFGHMVYQILGLIITNPYPLFIDWIVIVGGYISYILLFIVSIAEKNIRSLILHAPRVLFRIQLLLEHSLRGLPQTIYNFWKIID